MRYKLFLKLGVRDTFSDFDKFLRSRLNEWEMKQKEVDAKFLELSTLSDKLADVPVESKRKRKKTSSTSPKMFEQEDPFASYAADLQVLFFKKVHVQQILLVSSCKEYGLNR